MKSLSGKNYNVTVQKNVLPQCMSSFEIWSQLPVWSSFNCPSIVNIPSIFFFLVVSGRAVEVIMQIPWTHAPNLLGRLCVQVFFSTVCTSPGMFMPLDSFEFEKFVVSVGVAVQQQ